MQPLTRQANRAELQRESPHLDKASRGGMPAGEIAATDVDHLSLSYQVLHSLPDFVPRGLAIDTTRQHIFAQTTLPIQMLDLDLQPDTWALRTVLTADQRIA